MAVPKKKTSKSKRNQRRAHDSIVGSQHTECPNCGEIKLSHHMCSHCGYYKGREVVDMTPVEDSEDDE